jgi:lipoate-protein ligase A
LHDDEITYSYICPQTGESVKESYKRISQILVDAFAKLNIELTFGSKTLASKPLSLLASNCMLVSTGADLCHNGKKLIGSAQLRKEGYILQHGSILYDYNRALLEEIFNEPVQGMTSIKEINPAITKSDIIQILQNVNLRNSQNAISQ